MTIKRYLLVAAFILLAYCNALAGGVGTWKNYLAYSDVQWVEEGSNKLYVLASNSLYTYNKNDQSIKTYDKVNGLSDTDIRFIAWNKTARRLVIIYSNNNIDLLDDRGNVTNVPDYYLKTTMADKTVNGIDMSGVYCYLSTGFGLVKLNVAKAEISDSYNLSFPVNYSYIESGYIYAASQSNGLYRAALSANLLDRNNWTSVGTYVERPRTADAALLAQAKTLNPGGPKYNGFAYIQYLNNRLYTVPGMFKSGYADSNTPGAVQILHDGEWANYQESLSLKTGYDYLDNNVLAVDPRNANHVFVGGRTGLYEFLDGQLKAYYNKDNSLLQGAMYKGRELGNNYVLINGLCFDNKGDFWILNSQASRENLLRLSADGQMTSFSKPALMKDGVGGSVLTSMVFDNHNNLWFCNDHWDYPALFCYQPTTDKLLSFTRFVNEDGSNLDLVPHSVMPLSNGDVWVTTTIGPLLLSRSAIDNPETGVFTQVKVPRNDGTNLADYLLSGIDVTCMAIDGGGRKWFGTKANGVYLISADNMTQVKHITSSNSPLLSDNILSIAINNATGEVFFGTDKGLCSYMSDATTPSDQPSEDKTYAYPNPVKPGYTGPITIVGLSMNADVKIVTTNGVLVVAGISNGGSFVWNGKDQFGKPVASGVYMVESADEDGNNGVVCKVAILR